MSRLLVPGLIAVLSALAAPAFAQPPASSPPSVTAGKSMQEDRASWIADPHIHAFYDLSVRTFAAGRAPVDEAAYTRQAFAIFGAFGASRGVPPAQMIEHLKLIPGQVVTIVREDPRVLASYAAFTDALFGPE